MLSIVNNSLVKIPMKVNPTNQTNIKGKFSIEFNPPISYANALNQACPKSNSSRPPN
jgi:hypothetical protein